MSSVGTPARARVGNRLRGLGRGDLAVLAFCALGTGNLWARRGAGDVATPPNLAQYVGGMALVVVALALCVAAVWRPASSPKPAVCAAAILGQALLSPGYLVPWWATGLVGIGLAVVPLVRRPAAAWGAVAVAAGLTATVVYQTWQWAAANIDVFAEVQGGTAALLAGRNPYAGAYSVFLDSRLHHPVYGSGAFDYGPGVLLLSIPGRLLGDVRYSVLALNVAILGSVLIWSRRSAQLRRVGPTLAALWVASPFVPFMVLLDWTDSCSMAGLAGWLALRDRHRGWAVLALTLGVASKPTMLPLLVPLLLWTRTAWRDVLWAAVGTVAIVLPFAIWTGVPQFIYDTIGIYGDLPTRGDAVTVNGVVHALGLGYLPGIVLLAAGGGSVLVIASRRARDYSDLLLLGGALLTALCLLAKQAFLNYYFNTAMALLLAIAAGTLVPADAVRHTWWWSGFSSSWAAVRASSARPAASTPSRPSPPGS